MKIHSVFKSKLGRKLILYFFIVGLLPMFFFVYFLSVEYKTEFFNNISKDFKKNTNIISAKIFEDILERKNELRFISKTLQLKSISGRSDKIRLDNELSGFLKEFYKFSSFTVYDYTSKSLIYSTCDSSVIQNENNVFDLNSSLLIKYKTDKEKSGFADIFLYLPVFSKNNISLIIEGKLKNEYLWEVTKSLYQISKSNIIIFDENGEILIHSYSDDNSKKAVSLDIITDKSKNSDVFIQDNKTLGEIFVCYYKLYMKGQFGCGNWTVIITKKSDEVLDSINRLINTVFITSAITVLFLILAALILTRHISEPLSILVSGTKEISAGNLDFQANIKETEDEVGELLKSFNIMARNLMKTTVSKNYISSILNSINEVIIVINNEYIIESVNESIGIFGYIPLNMEKKSIEMLFGKNEFEDFKTKLYEFFNSGKTNGFTTNLIDKAGNKIPVDIQFTFFMNKNDNIDKIVIVVRDLREKIRMYDEKNFLITNLQESYKQLHQTQKQLIHSEKMAAVGILTAGITHEINTPMTYINWNLNALKRNFDIISDFVEKIINKTGNNLKIIESFDEKELSKVNSSVKELKNIIDEIKDGTEKVISIIKNLKEYSHPGTEKIQQVNINKIIENVLSVLHNKTKNQIKILKNFNRIPDIYVNSQQLNQVFMNILLNAAESVESNGIIEVSTFYNKDDRNIMIVITDNGIGIPEENISKIFEPFFTTKDVGKGVGLGLSIAYKIMKTLNGSISVESKPGYGSKFTVTLPNTNE